MSKVRPPAVAGTFYPSSPPALANMIQELLQQAEGDTTVPRPLPKALIVPHAGYIYSGRTAAAAYLGLRHHPEIRRIVLLGPSHHVFVRGLSLPGTESFATPLGKVTVDQAAVEQIQGMEPITTQPEAHADEHSLEVQIPFLQSVLGRFEIVPMAVGDATAEEVAKILDTLWGGEETAIVVSSDLSHYLPYERARQTDRETADQILGLHVLRRSSQACGSHPVNGLLLTARQRNLTPILLDLRNSGDTAGERDRVVGYGAFAFYERHPNAR